MVLKRTLSDEEISNPESKRDRGQSDSQNGRLFLFHDVADCPRVPPGPVESGLICYSPDTLIVGSINGLICSAGHSGYHSWPTPDDIWIWNPSTRLSKKLPIGKHTYTRFTNTQVTFAFCWDEIADVYKVLKMVSKKCEATKAEVWASSSDSWKDITNFIDGCCFYHPTHPQHLVPATHCDVVVESSPYWVVLDYDKNVYAVSFDVKTDELKRFPLPPMSDFKDGFLRRVNSKKLVVTSYKRKFALLDFSKYIEDPTGQITRLYDLWAMDHGGKWTKGKDPVVFDFYFAFCSNTTKDEKLVLLAKDGIKLYDLETNASQIIYGDHLRNFICLASTFDFVTSPASMEGFEHFEQDFCSLINLIWPADLQITYSEPPDAPRKLFVLLNEKPPTEEEMESDPDKSDNSAPLWECQSHFTLS